MSYDGASDSATMDLAKPYKGAVEAAVDRAIEALEGAFTDFDFETIVK